MLRVVVLLEAYFANNAYPRCPQQFQLKSPNVFVLDKQTLYEFFRSFRDTGSVRDRPRSDRPLPPQLTMHSQRRL